MPENSLTFGPLAVSPVFLSRVAYILVQEAPVVLTEAASATHAKRAALAVSVAASPYSYSAIFASHLAANINVTSAGALTGTVAAGTLDTPATDAALLAAVAFLWNTVSGVVTNP